MFCTVCVCVCVGSPLIRLGPVSFSAPLCFSPGLVYVIYIHSGAVQPEAKELAELQALKRQDALSPFVFLSLLLSCAHVSLFVLFDVALE